MVAIKRKRGVCVLLRREIVDGHRLDRLARKETNSIQLPLVQQHSPEPLVIVSRRNEARSSRWEKRRFSPERGLRMIPRSKTSFRSLRIESSQPVTLFCWHCEACISHSQRLEDAFTQRCFQRFAGDPGNQHAQDIRSYLVAPIRSWLIEQREFA